MQWWLNPASRPPPGTPWLVSVHDYHRMIEAAILTSEDPVELLEGRIVFKARQSPQCACAIGLIRDCLEILDHSQWRTRSRSGVTLSDSEPEPEIAVVRADGDYMDHHPRPGEIGLIAEVADLALSICQTVKARIYARAAIPSYWIVNLVNGLLECYGDPTGPDPNPAYRQRVDYKPGDSVPLQLPGQAAIPLAVRDFLP
jgi:Putative restriction endonuclease